MLDSTRGNLTGKCEISDGSACRILSISLGRQTISCHASDKYCFEREDSFEDVQNCTGVFFTAVHLPAVDNSFMLTGDLRLVDHKIV